MLSNIHFDDQVIVEATPVEVVEETNVVDPAVTKRNKKKTAGLLVPSIVFTIIASVFFVISLLTFSSARDVMNQEAENIGEGIGVAIGVVLMLLIYLIVSIISIVCTIPSIVCSIVLLSKAKKYNANIVVPIITLSICVLFAISLIVAFFLLSAN